MLGTGRQLQLFFDFFSPPSRALYIILKASGKSFEARKINLLKGEHFSEEFKTRVNRFQKVPAIIDGDFKLSESVAILRYFSNKQYIAERLYPTELKIRARVDEFLQWQHLGMRSSGSLYFRFQWVQAKLFGSPASPGKIEKYKVEMERDLEILENIWLIHHHFIAGDTLTAADIFGACELEQLRIMDYSVGEKFPKIAAWIEDVRRESQPYFEEAHQIVDEYEKETKANVG